MRRKNHAETAAWAVCLPVCLISRLKTTVEIEIQRRAGNKNKATWRASKEYRAPEQTRPRPERVRFCYPKRLWTRLGRPEPATAIAAAAASGNRRSGRCCWCRKWLHLRLHGTPHVSITTTRTTAAHYENGDDVAALKGRNEIVTSSKSTKKRTNEKRQDESPKKDWKLRCFWDEHRWRATMDEALACSLRLSITYTPYLTFFLYKLS